MPCGIVAMTPQNTQIINRAYQYSRIGDILRVTDYKKGAELGLANNIFQYQYTYDALHRLTGETTTSGNQR
jgi:hypothetical protein